MLAALVLSAAAPLSAQAQDRLPDDSGVSQYLESVPSGAGPTTPSARKPAPLPRRADDAAGRSGDGDATALRRIASSTASPRRGLTAKQKTKVVKPKPQGTAPTAPSTDTADVAGRSTAAAVASSVGSGGWLVAAALLVVTAAGGVALARRRAKS